MTKTNTPTGERRRGRIATRLSAAGAVAALALTAGAGPAAAWNPFTEPPRVFWCSVWPTFCNN